MMYNTDDVLDELWSAQRAQETPEHGRVGMSAIQANSLT